MPGEELCKNGGAAIIGRKLLALSEVDSTNTYLKRIALNGAPEGTVVVAEQQTAGRGRLNRSFQSPKGKGLYLSALLKPTLPPERLLSLTPLAGVAACCAIERICGVRPGIKWPNDLILQDRKLAGILTELVQADDGSFCVVLGIGVNMSQTLQDFSPDVAEIATSLLLCLGREISREILVSTLLEELDHAYRALIRDDLRDYLDIYRRDCVNLGKRVQLMYADGAREAAEALGIDEEFGLVVRTDNDSLKTVREGEVSVRGLYGYLE